MKVAVVGAGAAGLYAARILQDAGAEVVVYEKSARLGGRIWSRESYDPGGEWVDADHPLLIGLAEKLGLTLVPDQEDRFWHRAGERGLVTAEMEAAEEVFEEAVRSLQEGTGEEPTLGAFLAGLPLSDEGRWWLNAVLRSDEGDDLDQIGLWGWLDGYRPYLDREGGELSAYRLSGGMEALLRGLAEGLDLRFDRAIQTPAALEADAVLIAVPPPAVLAMELELEPPARAALESCRLSRTLKVILEFERPWWEDVGWNGHGFFDSPLQQSWRGRPTGSSALVFYVVGQDADFFSPNSAPVAEALNLLAEIYPTAREAFVGGELVDWPQLAGGGFSIRAPGFFPHHHRNLPRQQGRVFFAGEHLGGWYGFIEGALESGKWAAEAILKS